MQCKISQLLWKFERHAIFLESLSLYACAHLRVRFCQRALMPLIGLLREAENVFRPLSLRHDFCSFIVLHAVRTFAVAFPDSRNENKGITHQTPERPTYATSPEVGRQRCIRRCEICRTVVKWESSYKLRKRHAASILHSIVSKTSYLSLCPEHPHFCRVLICLRSS